MAGIGRQLGMLKRMNWVMTGCTLLLASIGVAFIYSAAYVYTEQPGLLYVRQIQWFIIGFIAYLLFTLIDYRRLAREGWWFYWGSIVLLVTVLVVGTMIHGGKRWLHLPVAGLGFQPSEFAKIAVIIVAARFMCRPRRDMGAFSSVVQVISIVAFPVLLIVLQPDVGTAMVFPCVVFAMMFAAGARMKTLVIIALVAVLLVSLALGVVLLPDKLGLDEAAQEQYLSVMGLRPYHKARIKAFLDPGSDPLGYGWNSIQSRIAVGSGRTGGKGFRQGTANVLGFLPRTVAPSDFIFSVIGEETGFVGCGSVLLLFGILFTGGLRVAIGTRDRLGRLLCVGVMTMLFVHVFINIAMTIGLMPITGLPLPLMSSGGSFVVSTMTGLGIVQSVYVRRRLVRYQEVFTRA